MSNNIIEKMTDEYISDLLVRAAHHSTAIEGNTLTLGDTISILIHNYIPKGMSEREYYEVKNYKKAFEFLLKSDKLITANLIKNYHKYIMENLREDNGEFKKIQKIILGSVIETTKPYLVPTVIEDWCQNLKYRLDNAKTNEGKIEAILDQHIKFEKIHPFGDGNGRTGRLLIIHSCLKENLAPILIPKEEKGKYINFLTSENLKEFVKWGIELEKKEKERIELFYNKEKENLWSKKIEKDKSKGNGRTGRLLIIHSCLKENLAPILIPKEEKGKYINFLTSENLKEFVKWGIELEKKEKERIELFYNKEKENLWSKKIEKDKSKGFGRD